MSTTVTSNKNFIVKASNKKILIKRTASGNAATRRKLNHKRFNKPTNINFLKTPAP